VIKLLDPAKIAHAHRSLHSEERLRLQVQRTIVKEPTDCNPGWK